MNTLLLVDGSNLMMRAAFGGDLAPERAAPIALGLIERAARQSAATHLVVALDSAPSWRKLEFPEYKAHRTRDTSPWLLAMHAACVRRGWYTEDTVGFEADDVIATIAHRAQGKCGVIVASSDSDLLVLTAGGAQVLKPLNGGKFELIGAAAVCQKYNIANPSLLTDFKALTGETGDNIPGVPGIGPVRAAKLLQTYGGLEAIITAGHALKCPGSNLVAGHEAQARRAWRLVSLRHDAPVLPIQPPDCVFQ